MKGNKGKRGDSGRNKHRKKPRDKKIKEAGHLYIGSGQNNCLIMPCASSAPPVLH